MKFFFFGVFFTRFLISINHDTRSSIRLLNMPLSYEVNSIWNNFILIGKLQLYILITIDLLHLSRLLLFKNMNF